jgi:CHAD domain-containing protein
MAKPLQTSKLDREMPVTKAAGLVVAVKARELWTPLKAVRSGDVEGVHDMRVSSKRLRETLRIFKPVLPKSGKRCLAHVDDLNDALGEVRDRDVLLLRLQALAAAVPKDADDIGLLSKRVHADRDGHFAALTAALDDHAGKKRSQAELAALAKKLASMARTKTSISVLHFAHAAVVQRLIPVFADNAAAREPDNVVAFHALRIKVKKLKYAIEPFLSVLPDSVKEPYRKLAVLQEEMGIVHDDDVLIQVLETFAAEHRPKRKLQTSMKHLRQGRQQRHAAVIAMLTEMEDDDLPQKLMDALD